VPSPPAKINTGISETPLVDFENGFTETSMSYCYQAWLAENDN
jgi:hypothetical protein